MGPRPPQACEPSASALFPSLQRAAVATHCPQPHVSFSCWGREVAPTIMSATLACFPGCASPWTGLFSDLPTGVHSGTDTLAVLAPTCHLSSNSGSVSTHKAFPFFTRRGFGLSGQLGGVPKPEVTPTLCECRMGRNEAEILLVSRHLCLGWSGPRRLQWRCFHTKSRTWRWIARGSPPALGLPCAPGAVRLLRRVN